MNSRFLVFFLSRSEFLLWVFLFFHAYTEMASSECMHVYELFRFRLCVYIYFLNVIIHAKH